MDELGGGDLRILLVDDEACIREVLDVALSVVAGHEVRACDSAVVAREVARGFQPDLLLLDLMMPDQDGIDALQQIRSLQGLGRVPVVFVTATVDPVMLARAQAQQPLAIIEKPVDVLTLGMRLESLLQAGPSAERHAMHGTSQWGVPKIP